MVDPVTIFSEPLVQFGIAGVVIGYALFTDFLSRKEARRMEAARIKREEEREAKAEAREKECVARIQHLENRHKHELLGVIVRNNQLIEAFLKDKGISIMKTPLPDFSQESEHR